jgi:hypothetical protein
MSAPRAPELDMNRIVGSHDILWVTLDTLRHDVAERALEEGRTPRLRELLPRGWERRHSPGNFTYAAHHAFFAGFLPTPEAPGTYPRRFAARFDGSTTTSASTFVFEGPDVPRSLAALGYHTVCVGGVGFFNKQNPLGSVFPALFAESHWSPEMGVTGASSTARQVDLALEILRALDGRRRCFLFVNVSALHQPNCIFTPGAKRDDTSTMAAALAYVDGHLGRLIDGMRARAPLYATLMSDHGEAYGEDGYEGHRLAHPVVWTVPFAELVLEQTGARE